MPVEDVDFLVNNSEKDSYLFFIDSTQRDRETFPTVSEYTVNFTEAFNNVYGLEVLDAMIPSTRYTMDVGRDDFKYHMAFQNHVKFPGFGDDPLWWFYMNMFYSIPATQALIDIDNGAVTGYYNFLTVFEKGTMTPEYVVEESPYKTVELSFIGVTLGTDVIIESSVQLVPSADEYHRVICNGGSVFYINRTATFYDALVPYITLGALYVDADQSRIITVDIYNISIPSYHALNAVTTTPSVLRYVDPNIYFTICNIHEKLEHGNYDIYTFQSYLNLVMPNRFRYLIGTTSFSNPFANSNSLPNVLQNSLYGTVEKQSKYKFTITTQNVLLFLNISRSTIQGALGFASKTPVKNTTFQYKHETRWPNARDYVVTTLPYGSDKAIVSPGVINMNGLSYVILRCPEIESHMYNSFSYSQNCPGIGMFKLGSLNQIFNVRFDFVNFVKKPFHPIGKLSKITLRFENTDGTLYDFKGVDHHMLLSVKFYVPRLKDPKQRFHLNPNYNPNYLEYMVNEMRIDDEQDDEANEWDHSQENKATILRKKYDRLIQEQNEYDYSSEDDQDEVDIVGHVGHYRA